MKSRRRILCLAALALVLAGAGFAAARLLHREAPDPQAPLPAFAFAQEAAPARILERAQEIAGGEPLFLLPVCEIDWEAQSYVPAESAYGGRTWVLGTEAGGLYRLAETFSPDLVLAIDDSENLGLPYDESLGRALLEEAGAQGCEPLALVYIGQHWLLAQDAEGAHFACGMEEIGGDAPAFLNEGEFLRRHRAFLDHHGPQTTEVVQLEP